MRAWMWTMAPGSDPAAEEEILAGWVDEATRHRAARCLPAARWPLLAGHALCCLQLAAAFGRPPETWRFVVTPEGRPVLADPPPGIPAACFSLSHSAAVAGCALLVEGAGPDPAIGFDLETPRDGRPVQALARRFLHAEEAARVAAADDPAGVFTRLWTLKEALTKALGRGIQEDFKGFSTQPDPPRLLTAPPAFGALRHWHVSAGTVGAALWALAVRGPAAPRVVRKHLAVGDIHIRDGEYNRLAD